MLRTIVAAFAFDVAEWALWVGVLVYAYEDSGPDAAGLTSVALLVASALVAPIAGVLADGRHPERTLLVGYGGEATLLAGATVALFLRAPVGVVVALTAGALGAVTFARPSTAVVVPSLVSTPMELTAANLLGGWCDSASVLVGPLAAAALLAADGPRAVFAACAGLTLTAALATLPLGRRQIPDAPDLDEVRRTVRPFSALAGCVRRLAASRASLLLLVVLSGQYVLVGALDLIYVVLAVDLLDLGSSGAGYLSAAFGAGSLAGGIVATVLIARSRLAPVLLVCLALIASSMLLLGVATTVATAFALVPVAGLGRALLDLTGRMLMQRVAPQDALASSFAALEAFACIAMASGAILAQTLVVFAGERVALVGVGTFFALLLLVVSVSRLGDVDAIADAPVVTIRLLRSIPLFAPLGGPALEALARAARPVEVSAGDTIMREGDIGEHYVAVVTGRFDVSVDGEPVRSMVRGQGFGEVALVASVPRTATVVAGTDGTILQLDREPFLRAVTEHSSASRIAWRTAHAYEPRLADGAAT